MPSIVQANAPVNVGGVIFYVDELTPLPDQQHVKFVLFGKDRISTQSQLPDAVIEAVAEHDPQLSQLKEGELVSLTLNSLQAGYPARAQRGFTAMLIRKDIAPATLSDAIRAFGKFSDALSMYRAALVALKPEQVSTPVLVDLYYLVGRADHDWFQIHLFKSAFDLRPQLKERALTDYKAALLAHDYHEMTSIVDFLGSLLGWLDDDYKRFRVVDSELRAAETDAEAGEFTKLNALLERSAKDTAWADLLAPYLPDLVRERAAGALKKSQPQFAIELLARLGPTSIDERTKEIVRKALAEVSPTAYPLTDNAQVSRVLVNLAARDSGIRHLYGIYLQNQVLFSLDENRPAEADFHFNQYLVVNPDPSPENDALRLKLVFGLLKGGHRVTAQERFSELNEPIGLFDHLVLVLEGIYVEPYKIAVMIFLFGGVLVFLVLRIMKGRAASPASTEHLPPSAGPRLPRAGLLQSLRYVLDPRFREYSRCLALFALTPGVELREVKNRYRDAVKEYHPDINKESEEGGSPEFIQLTLAYDRINELHKRLYKSD